MMKTRIVTAMWCAVLAACRTMTDEGAETRPVGQPVLSEAQLKEAREAVSFSKHVRPILEERCMHCHNKVEMPGKFSLETRAEAMADSRRIIPGNSANSLLITVLTTGNHALSMPAVGTAPPKQEIEVLKLWIDAGADWPARTRLRPRG